MQNPSAHMYHLRMSPRKVRLVADVVRGKSVAEAETILSFLPKLAAEPLKKLLHSAVANATHNFSADATDLMIAALTVDPGSMLKRFTPKAFGRAAPIRKRSCHIHLTLKSKSNAVLSSKKSELAKPVTADELQAALSKGSKEGAEKEVRKGPEKPQKGAQGGFFRKMFQRKSM